MNNGKAFNLFLLDGEVTLVKTPEPVGEDREDRELLLTLTRKIMRSHKVIEAYCKQTDEGFVVLAGS